MFLLCCRWYKDIDRAELDMRPRLFRFHVKRPLTPHFPGEYDPAGVWGQDGSLSMVLGTSEDVQQLVALLSPLLPCLKAQ